MQCGLPGLLLMVLPGCGLQEREAPRGVEVAAVAVGGAGARAGLQPGDRILSYRREARPPVQSRAAAGTVRTRADLAEAETEQAPRGPVVLEVLRAGAVVEVDMPPGAWRITARPGPSERPGDPRIAALTFHEEGNARLAADDFAGAERAFRAALEQRRRLAPGSLTEAASWHALGRLAQRRGEIGASDALFARALALRRRLAPDSVELSWTLNNLGTNAAARGDFAAARAAYQEALALARKRSPGSLDAAQVLNNLGLLERRVGDEQAARRWFALAALSFQRLDPDGLDLARCRFNLGLLALGRSDLEEAEEALRASLERFEAAAPESVEVGTLLDALGSVARSRLDLDEAETLYRRGLAIHSRLVPGSEAEAESLTHLASIAHRKGRLDEAERLTLQALALRRRNAPDGQEIIFNLTMLGSIAQNRGRPDQAASWAREALERQRKLAPGAVYAGEILQVLGEVALQQKRWKEAEDWLGQALAVHRRFDPMSHGEAEILGRLAQLHAATGQMAEAAEALHAAVAAVEAQAGRMGGSDEARSFFQAGVVEIYHDLLALQLRRGETAAALQTLERSRARALLDLLARRDLALRADVPAPLTEQQRRLEQRYDHLQREISEADPRDTAALDVLDVRRARLRAELAEIASRIARASPRYAALRYPRPLDLAGVRRALDPGTVLLSYCVTADAIFLFVVEPEGSRPLQVVRIPAGRRELADEVTVFRSLLLRGREAPAADEALLHQARRLYTLLVAPAGPAVERAQRLLISPDGPLHTLPFAALVRPGPPAAGPPPYLADWKPLHTVLSATLFAELRRRRPAHPETGPVVVFADPLYRPVALSRERSGGPGGPGGPALARYLQGLSGLPFAREEAKTLARLYGAEATAYLGPRATEEQAKRLPAIPQVLHFATHALIDLREPLDSALALAHPAPGSRDNGMLQAWEVFEQVRLDGADLVTLSSCETGLGKDAAGEGLIGLTRAFEHAGARSVLASLWAVSDRSTSELMARFYALRRAGRPKDEALAGAQRALLRSGGELAHPYHWAAFSLTGDRR